MPNQLDIAVTQSLTEINMTINNIKILRESTGVQSALNDLKEEVSQKPSAFSESGQVIDQLNSSIAVWENPKSNAADIVSSSLALTSKILFASGLGGLGFIIGLGGAIAGAFGSKKSTNYYNVLNTMINGAVNRLNSELIDESLSGGLREMETNFWTINDILDKGEVPKNSPITFDYSTKDFTTAATKQLGAAYKNLQLNLSYDHRENWENAAETFYTMSQILNFKVLLLTQAVAFFQLVDANSSDPDRRASVILDYLNNEFPSTAKSQTAPYMMKPDLAHGAITQAIYRLPDDKFRIVGSLMAYLNDQKMLFWPHGASQYRFKSSPNSKNLAVRISTWYDRKQKDPARVLFNDLIFHNKKHDGYKTIKTHWSLYPDTEEYSPQPYYRWFLQALQDDHSKGTLDIFLFEVKPTQEEIQKYNIPDPKENSLLIIGDYAQDKLWRATHEDHGLHHTSYADMISNKHTPAKCLWVLLNKTE